VKIANWLPSVAVAIALASPAALAASSVCYGTPERGALRDGCRLPFGGANFTVYSRLGASVGRIYVHCTVSEILLSAYADMAARHPDVRFVYGETGLASGGPFAPHKTHQNGLSVDFFVPVRDAAGRSVPLPTSAANRWGYDLEFDSHGRLGELTIDFEAMAQHLLALQRAAAQHHAGIAHVYFDTELQRLLRRTHAWAALPRLLPLSKRQGWWRHDEHYHVDFELPCRRFGRSK
jgi:penicillin-insensitive murein endopeptidase